MTIRRWRCVSTLIALTLLLTACRKKGAQDAATLFQQAQAYCDSGELPRAMDMAKDGLRRFPDNRDLFWHWKFHLLEADVLFLQARYTEAKQLLDSQSPASTVPTELQARWLLDEGRAAYHLGEYKESADALSRAFELVRAEGSSPLLADIECRRGTTFSSLNRASDAEASYRNALRIALELKDGARQGFALGNLAVERMHAERYDEAIPLLQRTEQLQPRLSRARTVNNLGLCFFQLGEHEKGIAAFRQAAAMEKEAGLMEDQEITLGYIAEWYEETGDYAAARSNYEQALALARRSQDRRWMGNWSYFMALNAIHRGDRGQAQEYNREAIELNKDAPLSDRLGPVLNSALIAQSSAQYLESEKDFRLVIEQATAATTNGAAAQTPVVLLEAYAGLANLLAETNRKKQAEIEFQNTVAFIKHNRSRLPDDKYKLSYFSGLIRFYQGYVEFLFAENRTEEALQVAESSRALLLQQKLQPAQAEPPRISASEFQRLARSSGTIFLSYWLAPQRSFLWVVTSQRITAFSLPGQAKIRALVRNYSTAIQDLHDPLESDNATGQELYQSLLAPAGALLPAGARVAIVPDGALYNLNFETLPAGDPRHPHYWIEDATVSIIPSLTMLASRRASNRVAKPSLLLMGDPAMPAEAEFQPLRYAGSEIENVREEFASSPALVLTGAAAQPAAFAESKPAQFSIIHFAAHATTSSEDPLDSAVILAPRGDAYKLYARDIIRTPLRADLVTVSACRSAGATTYAGEGIVGFAWAFLGAGARNVVAGLWEVDDRSTAAIMRTMYAEYHRRGTPQEALRRAKLDLIHAAGPLHKPYYWAPFQVLTDVTEK